MERKHILLKDRRGVIRDIVQEGGLVRVSDIGLCVVSYTKDGKVFLEKVGITGERSLIYDIHKFWEIFPYEDELTVVSNEGVDGNVE
jgi:hypothetical protein